MSELKDPEIKLFGKTISLPQNNSVSSSVHADHHDDRQSSSNTAASEDKKVNTREVISHIGFLEQVETSFYVGFSEQPFSDMLKMNNGSILVFV